ncbi:MAG TPA: GNAT family N-acetyltransferase [Ilumatobacteraceae bacterium]|nr:GNAT family N-acetyltransferase [Ilumatobacteraceae bacterium]
MRIEPLTAQHREALVEFVAQIAERDRLFVDRTLISQVKIASWTKAVPERRLVAVDDDGSVGGLVTVSPGVGWSAHTAEVRLLVGTAQRGKGVGKALAHGGIELAQSMGIEKLWIETMAANAGGQAIFLAFGFTEEATLRGQVRDEDGNLQDIVVLTRWLTPHAG